MERCTFFIFMAKNIDTGIIISVVKLFMIYKIINYELVKYESWASLLVESDLLVHPIPPLFLWFLKHTLQQCGRAAAPGIKVLSPASHCSAYTFLRINTIQVLAPLLLVSMPC